MHGQNSSGGDPPPPLTSLRLLVPPVRLVSAAIWQTVQHKVVANYGLLEEFITVTTEIVPELLNPNQRAQLLLGLQASVVLEHCHSEPMADVQTIQSHLDRIQTLMAVLGKEDTNAEEELSGSNFLDLIPTLLKDQDKRQSFFQDVFPIEFGLKYDRAIRTLVWHFLSRLERLLQAPKLQEVASLLSDVPSVLEECFESISDLKQFKSLLEYHKNFSQLESNDADFSSCGDCILRALNLPSVEGVMTVNEQTATGAHVESISEESKVVDAVAKVRADVGLSACIGETQQMQQSQTEETSKQYPVCADNTIEDVGDFVDIVEIIEDTEPLGREQMMLKERDLDNICSTEDFRSTDIESEDAVEKVEVCETLIVIGKDLRDKSDGNDMSKAKQQEKSQDVTSIPTLLLSRPERPNRGLKMKTLLAQGRRTVKKQVLESTNSQRLSHVRTKQQTYQWLRCGKYLHSNLNLKRHTQSFCSSRDTKTREFKCTICGKTFPRSGQVKCHMISHSNARPYQCSNCERSFKHLSSMKAHEEVCLYASQQRGEVSSGRSSSTTAGMNDSVPLKSLHQTSTGETTDMSDNVGQAPSPVRNPPLQNDLKALQRAVEIPAPSSCLVQVLPQPSTTNEGREQEAKTSLHSLTQSTCTKAMQSSGEMVHQMVTHSSDVIYNCTNCQKTYKYFKNLQKHEELCKKGTNQNLDEKKIEAANETVEKLSPEGRESISGASIETSDCNSSVKTSSDRLSPGGTKLESSKLENLVNSKTFRSMHRLKKNPLSCPHCGTTCKTKNEWTCHVTQICQVQSVKANESLKRVGKRKSRKCDQCGKEFGLRSTLRAHKLTHNSLYCAECRKVCPDAETLAAHNVMHRPVRCTMCDKSFNVVRFLIRHYLDVHQFSGPFVCTHCPKSYTELSALIRHERTHTGDLPFQCAKCPKKFNRHIDLVYHERTHSGEKRFLCWECGKAFSTNEILRKHMERHVGQQKHLSCPKCNRTFGSKKAVDEHVEVHHKGIRFPCSYCSKLFLSRSALRRHDLIHTGEKPFKCTHKECGKSFRSSAELRIHTRYHTGERPFKCHICEKGFVQAHYLTIHLRSHTQERPYACPNCEKRFTTRNQLNRHKLIHTGEKPFRCEVCDEGFNRRHRLKVHQDKYHT